MKKLKIEVLPSARLFDEREYGLTHTPYEIETALYSCIGRGDVDGMKALLEKFLESGVVAGKLSSNNTRQMQYWAVCCVAIATRYAIAGGCGETFAYNFSDECIMQIDAMNNEGEILDFLLKKGIVLAETVKESKLKSYPAIIRKCLKIIDTHLFEDIDISALAKECGISKDYLSVLFKKYLGVTASQYIKKEKLKSAKELLESGMSISHVTYTVGFSSESYFIKCFKDEFGVTPGKLI